MVQRSLALALGLLLLLIGSLLPQDAHAIDDPTLSYHTITTPHFYIHYYDGLEALARRSALLCEEAHTILSPLLAWKPASRTHVVVIDRLDAANGSATTYARNQITLFGMAPEADSVLGFYDDWLRVLIYHEYVHILHLDTTYGIWPWINVLIGKQVPPNRAMPRWYVEGLAVHMESVRTGGGRNRSSLFKLWMREAALAGQLDLGRASHSPTSWPFGSVAYLYGGLFLQFVAEHYGENFFTKYHEEYGSWLVPGALNATSREINKGAGFEKMWQGWTAAVKGEALAHQIAVQARGETQLEMVTEGGGDNKFARVRPGHGQISYFGFDYTEHPSFTLTSVDRPERKEQMFLVDGSYGAGGWGPKGRHFVYSRGNLFKNLFNYQDLFLYDSKTKKHRRLTRRERAREPAIDPTGSRLVYVRNRSGTTELVLRRLQSGPSARQRVLIKAADKAATDTGRWNQISTPAWRPDGRAVVVSMWSLRTRERDLWMVTLPEPGSEEEPLMERLTMDHALDLDPHFGPDGMLYFSSDRSGTFNIYAMQLSDRKVFQVSEVSAGLFTPRVSEDGQWIYATGYGPKGYDIVRFARPTRLWKAAAPSKALMSRVEYPAIDTSSFVEEDYQPWPWMLPLTLTPNVGFISGVGGLGLRLQGADPLRRHTWGLGLGFLLDPQIPRGWGSNIGLQYRYGRLPFDVTINGQFNEYIRERALFRASEFQPYVERQWIADLGLSYPLRGIFESVSLRLGYTVDNRDYGAEPAEVEPEPGDLQPRDPELGWYNTASVNLVYAALESWPLSISPERGFSANVGFAMRHPLLGADFESVSFSYGLRGFWPVPFLPRHVLVLKLNGAIIHHERLPQIAFNIGGPPVQNILRSVVFNDPLGGLYVRGFPGAVARGSHYQIYNFEWRFPIWDMEQGFGTAPLFFRRLKGRAFADLGLATRGYIADAEPFPSVGAELELEFIAAYVLGGSLRVGYARGFGEQGLSDVYLLYGGGF